MGVDLRQHELLALCLAIRAARETGYVGEVHALEARIAITRARELGLTREQLTERGLAAINALRERQAKACAAAPVEPSRESTGAPT
jgi:hypothetical protein